MANLAVVAPIAVEGEPGPPAVPDAGEWRMALELRANALRVCDPVPLMVSQFEAIPGLAEHRSVLYTVLSELYANALEHGVLAMSASLKQAPGGLERYLDERESRLAALSEGWVRLSADCKQWQGGGELVIRAADSGPGFDWTALPTTAPDEPHSCGLHVLRALCVAVGFEGKGNQAYAIYRWGSASAAERGA